MKSPEQVLMSQGVPTSSFVKAGLHINATDLSEPTYRSNIEAILGVKVEPFDTQLKAKMAYAYFTQNFLKKRADGPINVEELYLASVAEANKKMTDEPYLFFTPSDLAGDTPRLDATGNEIKKKGWKRDEAERLFQEADDQTRAAMIKVFVEKLDMTTAGASTYFANCKKKFS